MQEHDGKHNELVCIFKTLRFTGKLAEGSFGSVLDSYPRAPGLPQAIRRLLAKRRRIVCRPNKSRRSIVTLEEKMVLV